MLGRTHEQPSASDPQMSRNGSAGCAPHSADQPAADRRLVARSFRGFCGSAARRYRPIWLVGIALRARLLRSDAGGRRGFYLDLYRRGDFHRALSVPASPGLNSDASPNWFDRGIRFSTSAVAKAPWRRICRTLLVSDSTRIVMRTLPSSTSGAKRLRRMPHHIPKNRTPSAPFTPSSTWPTRWTLPAIW